MKVFVTGHTRGLGLEIYNFFLEQNYEVTGFSYSNGFDLEKDLDRIVATVTYDSIFVNNAYANGMQIKYLELLDTKVSKIITSGSIASAYPDPLMIQYSLDKKILRNKVYELGLQSQNTKHLLLNLTSSSYKDFTMIKNSLKFWLQNPNVLEIGYTIND